MHTGRKGLEIHRPTFSRIVVVRHKPTARPSYHPAIKWQEVAVCQGTWYHLLFNDIISCLLEQTKVLTKTYYQQIIFAQDEYKDDDTLYRNVSALLSGCGMGSLVEISSRFFPFGSGSGRKSARRECLFPPSEPTGSGLLCTEDCSGMLWITIYICGRSNPIVDSCSIFFCLDLWRLSRPDKRRILCRNFGGSARTRSMDVRL
jgi:hypothetical protein